jgi:predicted acylesterase/phospholipase RssA
MMKLTLKSSFLIFLTLVLASCAGTKRKSGSDFDGEIQGEIIRDSSVTEESLPGEVYGPSSPGSSEQQSPIEGTPAESEISTTKEDPKLCLILGPGMAKAIAHASVLEAIHKAKIPVHCVVGAETGALVGALYSLAKGNTNSLQWQLFKLNKDNYFHFPVLSLREPKSNGKKLHDYLVTLFKNKKIEELPIRFGTVLLEEGADEPVFMQKGNLSDVLSASMAVPDIFESWRVDGKKYFSGAFVNPAPIALAKELGGNFFVLINVVEESGTTENRFHKAFSPARNLLKLQKKEASFVISVKMPNVGFDDFSRQGEILSAGQKSAEEAIPELKMSWEKWIASQQN